MYRTYQASASNCIQTVTLYYHSHTMMLDDPVSVMPIAKCVCSDGIRHSLCSFSITTMGLRRVSDATPSSSFGKKRKETLQTTSYMYVTMYACNVGKYRNRERRRKGEKEERRRAREGQAERQTERETDTRNDRRVAARPATTAESRRP